MVEHLLAKEGVAGSNPVFRSIFLVKWGVAAATLLGGSRLGDAGRNAIRVLNETQGTVLAEQGRVADHLWSRFWGLMGRRSLPEGEALLIIPCSSVHTAFMRFPIDVVFLDVEDRVVKVVSELKPFRIAMGMKGARRVLELPAGTAGRARLEQGDRLIIGPAGDAA